MQKIENTHRVPVKQWRKWDAEQRALFNDVYEEIASIGISLFVHPVTVQRKIDAEEFRTIAWNAAWIAADVLRKNFATEVATVHKGRVIAVDPTKRQAA